MTRARIACLLLLLPLALVCAGCASLHPRLTLYAERGEAETTGGGARLRTTSSKTGASVAIDLP